MTNNTTQGKHTDRYVSVDSCKDRNHGVGIGVCRIHQKADRCGHYVGKHRAS